MMRLAAAPKPASPVLPAPPLKAPRPAAVLPPADEAASAATAVPGDEDPPEALEALSAFMRQKPRRRRLGNGLWLISLPAPGDQVGVVLSAQMGARHDPAGQAGLGFALLQAMSLRSRYLDAQGHQALVEESGGRASLQLGEDFCAFTAQGPAAQLARLMWAVAERFGNAELDEAGLALARRRLAQARQAAQLAHPYARLDEAACAQGFLTHPYQRGLLGEPAGWAALSLDALRQHRGAWLRPDNAALIVTGRFDAAELDRLAETLFGSLRAPVQAAGEQQRWVEPARPASQSLVLQGWRAPLPAVALVWQLPPADSPERPLWELAQAVLGQGRSGRLVETLVQEQGVAHSLVLQLRQHAQAGLLVARAVAARGQAAGPLLAALRRELLRLAEEPISAPELDKARRLLRVQLQRDALDPVALAGHLARQQWQQGGVLRSLQQSFEAWSAVDGAQIQRLWRERMLGAAWLSLSHPGGGDA
ncbi:insulinase family protein [Pelomonas sp. CA6]|uniref:M16 family metallopeptidase n=1 Tax=Pelomonas sp. CA6 TaxID=2907999 RepID=UPI001F4A9D23|nr:insulinase family protein [Pelomonas sp. CA6]MCH7342581.1 insulinase family protein [Pelomonas sp. CA6]